MDLFSDGPAVSISSGTEIDHATIKNILGSTNTGNECYKTFISKRLITGSMTVFDVIPRNNLNTGIKIAKKPLRKLSLVQEDCQAFGVLVGKAATLEEAFHHPLIFTVPLRIVETATDLRSSDKAGFCNFILKESAATKRQYLKNAKWIIDGTAAIRTIKPEARYKEFFQKVLQVVLPPKDANHVTLEVVMDNELLKKQCKRMHSKETREVKYTCVHHRFGTEDAAGKHLA